MRPSSTSPCVISCIIVHRASSIFTNILEVDHQQPQGLQSQPALVIAAIFSIPGAVDLFVEFAVRLYGVLCASWCGGGELAPEWISSRIRVCWRRLAPRVKQVLIRDFS